MPRQGASAEARSQPRSGRWNTVVGTRRENAAPPIRCRQRANPPENAPPWRRAAARSARPVSERSKQNKKAAAGINGNRLMAGDYRRLARPATVSIAPQSIGVIAKARVSHRATATDKVVCPLSVRKFDDVFANRSVTV